MSRELDTIFKNRFVQVIMLSGVLLQIGIWVRNFAILLFVMEKTNNNAVAVSLISVAEFVPIFLFSFIGGTFADRWRPKLTMIWCDLVSAISVFLVLLTIIFGRWESVFFVTFISAILSQFSQPSAMKLIKVHVPGQQLQIVMSMFQTLMATFMIIGPMLGTLVYQRFGIYLAVSIMGAAFLLSACVLILLPSDQEESKNVAGEFWVEFKAGFSYVWSKKELSFLGTIFFISGLAVGIIQPLAIFIVVERLNLPKESLQWLLAVNGAAMLLGGVVVAGLAKRVTPQKLLFMGLLADTITVAGVGLSTNWYLTLFFQFLSGFFMPCIHIGTNTLILCQTEENFVGRVNGVLNPLFIGSMLFTMSLAGWLKLHLSLVVVYCISSILFLLGLLLTVPLLKIKENKTA
ncbi:MFS transporter [Bacillota bacterium LX-D]|nr:MFS transporter [Bacillota bacterium LX-D]